MTFIGKILVIVVMAFSLIFLGISTVALSTAKELVGRDPEGADDSTGIDRRN